MEFIIVLAILAAMSALCYPAINRTIERAAFKHEAQKIIKGVEDLKLKSMQKGYKYLYIAPYPINGTIIGEDSIEIYPNGNIDGNGFTIVKGKMNIDIKVNRLINKCVAGEIYYEHP